MDQPTVSVIIPTHNRPEFLAEAVETALAQTAEILEVIVIDDASDIDPRPALARFGDRVRYERLETGSGANVARNRGVALARGELVAFLDDDDLWLPDKIALQLAAMGGTAEACLCGTREADGATGKLHDTALIDEERLRHSTPCGTSGLLARREAMLAEPFDPAITRAQDWDVYVRLARRRPLAYVPQPLYMRRTGHDRITTAALEFTPQHLFKRAAALHKHRDWLGDAAYRRRLARAMLSFIAQRRGKARYLVASVRVAGLRATLSELLSKVRREHSR